MCENGFKKIFLNELLLSSSVFTMYGCTCVYMYVYMYVH